MRSPCCDEKGLKKGPWTEEEDRMLVEYISKKGHGSWRSLPKLAGLNRCGKSCRLRWTNYLKPDIKRGKFTDDEERIITNLHSVLGNKWSKIAAHLPGRTDNEIKNFWNTHMRKKMLQMGFDPTTHRPRTDYTQVMNLSRLLLASQIGNLITPNWDNPQRLPQLHLLQGLMQQLIGAPTNLVNPNHLFDPQNVNPFDLSTLQPQSQPQCLEQKAEKNENENPWACFEDLLKSEDNVDDGSALTSTNSSHENQIEKEKALPNLVPASSPETCAPINNQVETMNIFDDLEKLINDDDNSFWRDILAENL